MGRLFLNYDVYLFLIVVLILANSADPDEMQNYSAFHLDFHCKSNRLGVFRIQSFNLKSFA